MNNYDLSIFEPHIGYILIAFSLNRENKIVIFYNFIVFIRLFYACLGDKSRNLYTKV